MLLRFLGLADTDDPHATPSIRTIAKQLDTLPPDESSLVAAFALVLARVAHADLETDEDELAEMRRIVAEGPSMSEQDAKLVVDIVQAQTDAIAGSEGYLVTRELKRTTDRAQRLHLLRCLHAVAAADGSISTVESQEIVKIGEELGFSRSETSAVRSEFREHLAEIQGLRRED